MREGGSIPLTNNTNQHTIRHTRGQGTTHRKSYLDFWTWGVSREVRSSLRWTLTARRWRLCFECFEVMCRLKRCKPVRSSGTTKITFLDIFAAWCWKERRPWLSRWESSDSRCWKSPVRSDPSFAIYATTMNKNHCTSTLKHQTIDLDGKTKIKMRTAHQIEHIPSNPFIKEFNRGTQQSYGTTRIMDISWRPTFGLFEAVLKMRLKKL